MTIESWPRWADMPEFHALPFGWRLAYLTDIVQIIAGQSPPSETYNQRRDGLPFLQGCAEFGDEHPCTAVWCAEPAKRAPSGSTLMSVRAPVGDINRADQEYAIGRGLAALVSKDADPDFLYYGLHRWRHSIQRLGQGSTFEAITARQLRQVVVALPEDRKEQLGIAVALKLADDAIQKAQAELDATQDLKRSLMKSLFVSGMPGRHTEFIDTKIGRIPKGWQVRLLGDILVSSQYGLSESMAESGRFPILRMNNIDNGIVNSNDVKYIDLDDATFEIFRLKAGDILFNRTNSIEYVGRVGIVNDDMDAVFASYLIRLVADTSQVDPWFLNFCLNSTHVKNRYRRYATPAVQQANINPRNLRKTLLAFPPLESNEQHEIVGLLRTVDDSCIKLSTKVQTLMVVKRSLLQNLLTGKVRVPPSFSSRP